MLYFGFYTPFISLACFDLGSDYIHFCFGCYRVVIVAFGVCSSLLPHLDLDS